MSAIHPVPTENQVHEILSMLYGDELVIDAGESAPVANDGNMFAVYTNDEGEPSTACVCNYNFVAFAGSSLTRIPVGGAEDAAETGDFSEMMLSNLYEILNICSRVFMDNSSPHIRLDTVYKSLDDASDNVRTMFDSAEERVDFSVTIPGYGDGTIAFMCT